MAGEGGRRGIPWGRRRTGPPAETSPPASEAPQSDPTQVAGTQAEATEADAPQAPAGQTDGPVAPQPTFERVEAHDAAESGHHSHPSYSTIDRFPEREPGGEPGFSSAQEVDDVAYAQAESPAEASAHARVTSEPPREEGE